MRQHILGEIYRCREQQHQPHRQASRRRTRRVWGQLVRRLCIARWLVPYSPTAPSIGAPGGE